MSNDITLPPLPDPVDGPHTVRVFATSQMVDYARAAVLAERERCAQVCESLFDMDDTSCNEAEKCAKAIRAGVQP